MPKLAPCNHMTLQITLICRNLTTWGLWDNTWIYSFGPQVPLCCSIDSYLLSELLKTHHARTMLGGSLFFKERTSSWEWGLWTLDQQFSKLKDPVLTYVTTILQILKNTSQNSTITNHHWKFIIYPPVFSSSLIVKEGTSRLGSGIWALDSQFSNIKTQLWHVTAILKNQKIQSNNLLWTSNSLPVFCRNAMVVWKFSNTQNWRLINLQEHETGGSLTLKIFKNSESKVITISKKHPTLVHTHNRKPDFNRFYEDIWVKSSV
jgi:hypothetical protein